MHTLHTFAQGSHQVHAGTLDDVQCWSCRVLVSSDQENCWECEAPKVLSKLEKVKEPIGFHIAEMGEQESKEDLLEFSRTVKEIFYDYHTSLVARLRKNRGVAMLRKISEHSIVVAAQSKSRTVRFATSFPFQDHKSYAQAMQSALKRFFELAQIIHNTDPAVDIEHPGKMEASH